MIGRRDLADSAVHLRNPAGQQHISIALRAAMLVLGLLALIYFIWPAYRAFLPLQIENGGAWNAYHADMIRAGLPLYTFDDFVMNNYPPLSFYLLNALSATLNVDVLYIGRVLSLAATAGTAIAVWACIRSLGGSQLGAMLGAVWWLASVAKWYSVWVGRNDPHLVALAVMTGCLAYILRNPKSDRALIAIVLMAIAGFYKHSLVALPIAALFLLTQYDRRRGLRAALIGLGTVGLGLAVCGAFFGAAFFHDMLLPRVYHVGRAFGHLGLTQFIAPALIIAVIWTFYRRQTFTGRFVAFFTAIALVTFMVQSMAEGVADNAIFELSVATAIGLGCAFSDLAAIPRVQSWGLERVRIAVVCILIARFLFSQHLAPYMFLISPSFRADLNERISVMKAESARLAALPGLLACDRQLACRFAGKPFVFDHFIVRQLLDTGKLSQQDLAERMASQKIRLVTVDPRVDVADLR
jgi:hypothetical protein